MPLFMFNGKLNAYEYQGGRDNAQLIFGQFHATLPGYGLPVNSVRTWITRGNADDGGKALGAGGAYLYDMGRLLITHAQTGSVAILGRAGRLSVNADVSGVNTGAGLWGLLEVKASGVIGGTTGMGAVLGDIKIDSGGDIATGKVASCFLAHCESLGATHTGKAVALHVPAADVGAFDGLMEIATASGIISPHNVGSASTKQILFSIDGSPYAIQVYAVGT